MGRRSRGGTDTPGYVYELARRLRKKGTDSEQQLWECLRDRRLGGCKFRRQHPPGRYIADFCCAEAKVAIELDGAPHRHQRQAENDRIRDEELRKRGVRVLRVASKQVHGDLVAVLGLIAEAVGG